MQGETTNVVNLRFLASRRFGGVESGSLKELPDDIQGF